MIREFYPAVDPSRLTADNFFDYLTAIKEKLRHQREARMNEQERMIAAVKREIDEKMPTDDEYEGSEEVVMPENDGQAALLAALGLSGSAAQSDAIDGAALAKVASGYGR